MCLTLPSLSMMIRTGTGLNLWSAAYEREVEGVLATQENISREVAGTLQLQFAEFSPGAALRDM